MTDLTFTQHLNASPSEVYRALTNTMMAQRWLCNTAVVNAAVGGAYLFAWGTDYHAAGYFTALEENQSVAFTWLGRGEPASTTVTITLAEADGKTELTLVHAGVGDDDAWSTAREQISKGWESGLENLAYVLENGLDLRIMRRPLMGVFFNPISEEDVETLSLPIKVGEGVKIANVLPDSAAHQAGLQPEDVVHQLDGEVIDGFGTYLPVVNRHQAGDTVDLVFYRGAEKHEGPLTFGQRPVPEIPATPAELADVVQESNTALINELRDLIADVPDDTLAQAPADGEWSVLENIAHVIWVERYVQMSVWGANGGNDNVPYGGNDVIHISTLTGAYPTGEAMLNAYIGCKAETVALLRALPESFVNDRMSYMNTGQNFTGLHTHDRSHFTQITQTLTALSDAVAD